MKIRWRLYLERTEFWFLKITIILVPILGFIRTDSITISVIVGLVYRWIAERVIGMFIADLVEDELENSGE